MSDTVNVLKGISIPLVLILGFLPGIFPVFSKRCQQNKKCLSVINAFSGGIFLAIGLLHIYPEAIIDYENDHPHSAEKFPLPATCYILGFLMIFALEKIICRKHHTHGHNHDSKNQDHKVPHQNDQSKQNLAKLKKEEIQIDNKEKERESSFWNSFVIVIAMSLHSIFEGLALGLEEVEDDLIGLFLAIVLHKWAMSLSLGILLIRTNKQKPSHLLILMIIYSLITPIGIGIGWAILSFSTGLTSIIFNAFSAGTFLYIGALQIPEHEFSEEKDPLRLFKYLMYTAGFILMMIVDVITKNSYGHGH